MHKNLADGTHEKNVGTAGVGVTAEEYGNGFSHVTKLTLASVPITIGDTAALSMGSLVYTLPAGVCNITSAAASIGLTLTTGTPTTDTPEIALGTTIGSGANATIGAVDAAAENIAGPHVMDDIAGTAELIDSTVAAGLYILAAGDHTIYLNFADTWANVDDTAATASGTIHIAWTFLS